jgi:GntR family transcriptional regulator
MERIERDRRPLYAQVRERLLETIKENQWSYGYKLPSEPDLAEMLGVSRTTIRGAVKSLEAEGILESKQGYGTFVIKKTSLIESGIEKLRSLTETIESMGYRAGTKYLDVRETKADAEMAKLFSISEGEEVVLIDRFRTADDVIVAVCIDSMPKKLLPSGYKKKFFSRSVFDALEKEAGIYVEYSISKIKAMKNPEIARKIDLPEDTVFLMLDQSHCDKKGQVVYHSKTYFIGDRFDFHVIRKR